MKRKLIFLFLATLLLTPWPVAYAYDNGMAGQSPSQIETAAPEASPKLNAFGNATGSVTPGDLFYIDNGSITADTPVSLHITNTDELVHSYRYMTLKVGIYVQTGTDQWEKATTGNGELLPDTYITMLNGRVSFTLPGYAKYKITIDKGCFYCYGTGNGESAALPTFYLSVG